MDRIEFTAYAAAHVNDTAGLCTSNAFLEAGQAALASLASPLISLTDEGFEAPVFAWEGVGVGMGVGDGNAKSCNFRNVSATATSMELYIASNNWLALSMTRLSWALGG